jgi:hypothetical protein
MYMELERGNDLQINKRETICPLILSERYNHLTIPRAVIRRSGIKHGDLVFFTKEAGKIQLQLYRGKIDDSRC